MVEGARVVVSDVYRKSPFAGLLEHASKIHECNQTLHNAIELYCRGNFKEFEKRAKKVSELEAEADLIKANIRAHLPKFILMPVDKGDFLMLLREMDSILDYSEEAAVTLSYRNTSIPPAIKRDILAHMHKVIKTVKQTEDSIAMLRDILETSFGKKPRDELKKMIKKIHRYEWEADQIHHRVSKRIFQDDDIDPVSTFQLILVVDYIDNIADHAENAGDRLRAMVAK